jgi:type IV fimbrial biogenesis protein FimT
MRTTSHSRRPPEAASGSSKFARIASVPMNGMTSTNRNTGFTLFELVVVIAIVGILAAIGTPTFKYITASNRIAAEVNGLLGDMQYARSLAIKEGQSVTVCASTDQLSCSGANAWASGWIVFMDPNINQTVDAGETIMRAQPPFTGGDSFTGGGGGTPAFTSATFNRLGYAPTGQAAVINISLHDSTNTAQWTRCLAVNPIGSVVTEKNGEHLFGATATTCS